MSVRTVYGVHNGKNTVHHSTKYFVVSFSFSENEKERERKMYVSKIM